jgi:hypothetical protein
MEADTQMSWEDQVKWSLYCVICGGEQLNIALIHATSVIGNFALRIHNHLSNLQLWHRNLEASRDIVNALSLRHLDIEIVYSERYLQVIFDVDGLISQTQFSNDQYTFKLVRPAEVLIRENSPSPCDLFGKDQLGFRSQAHLITKIEPVQTFEMLFHFAFGISAANEPASLYIARDVSLTNHSIGAGDEAVLERLITPVLHHQLETKTLPAPDFGPIGQAGRKITYLSVRTNPHFSLFAAMVPAAGGPAIPAHPPLASLQALEGWEDEVIRISTFVLFGMIRAQIDTLLTDLPAVRYDGVVERVIPDPKDGSKNVLSFSANIFCITEFDDRESYGVFAVGLRIGTQPFTQPNSHEVYAESFLIRRPDFPSHIPVPDPPIPRTTMRIFRNVERLEQRLDQNLLTISVRYLS